MSGVDTGERRGYPPGFWVLWSSVVLELIHFGIVFPILPVYSKHFGASPRQAGLLISVYSLASVLSAPVWGWISDRLGRKRVLLAAIAGSTVGSLFTAVAGSLGLLFAARAVDGLSGGVTTVASAAVGDMTDDAERPKLMGLIGAAFGIGFVLGPAIGALGSHFWGPRAPFVIAAVLGVLNLVSSAIRVQETNPDHRRTDSSLGLRAAMRMVSAVIWVWLLVSFFHEMAFSGFETSFSLLLNDRFNLTQAAIGGVFAGIGLTIVLCQTRLVDPLVRRVGSPRAVLVGLSSTAFGLAGVGLSRSMWILFPFLLLVVLGQGVVNPNIRSTVVSMVGGRRSGQALGVMQSLSGVGRVLGPYLAGLLYERVSYSSPFVVSGTVVALVALWLTGQLAKGDSSKVLNP